MKRLPFRPNLDQIRKQAKNLLRDLRQQSASPSQIRLSTAQAEVAREHGFHTWMELKAWADRMRRIEAHATRFSMVHSRDFPTVRDSGQVNIGLLNDGARGHPNPRVRALCLGLLDHLAGDESVPIYLAALRDPVPRVRKGALHALSCERCKAEALCADVVPPIAGVALSDPNEKIRLQAVCALIDRNSDFRATEALRAVAQQESHPGIRAVARGDWPRHRVPVASRVLRWRGDAARIPDSRRQRVR